MTQKVALVTGAGVGIGAAISRRLASEGIAVGVLDLNLNSATKVADEITAEGGKAIPLGADVTDRAQVTAAVCKLRNAFGPVTIVVNNAAISVFRPFEEITDDDWDKTLDTNLKGPFIVTQTVLPDMKAAKWGRVVNISSTGALGGAIGLAHYTASKGGMISMTRTLALELGPLGVTVNNIPPGSVADTLMFQANKELMNTSEEKLAQSLPVRRVGVPDDIANACAWLVSDATGYVTGQTICVNGGRVFN